MAHEKDSASFLWYPVSTLFLCRPFSCLFLSCSSSLSCYFTIYIIHVSYQGAVTKLFLKGLVQRIEWIALVLPCQSCHDTLFDLFRTASFRLLATEFTYCLIYSQKMYLNTYPSILIHICCEHARKQAFICIMSAAYQQKEWNVVCARHKS